LEESYRKMANNNLFHRQLRRPWSEWKAAPPPRGMTTTKSRKRSKSYLEATLRECECGCDSGNDFMGEDVDGVDEVD
jgi:hypothetical protein